MGRWIKLPGGQKSLTTKGSGRVDLYQADGGRGVQEAAERGLARGVREFFDGELLELSSITPTTADGLDTVELKWTSPDNGGPRGEPPARRAGDEEWSFEGSTQEVPKDQFHNANGDSWSETFGTDEVFKQPRGRLVWRKWLNKSFAEAAQDKFARRRPVPTAKEQALVMAAAYTSGSSTFETGGPRMGCVMGSSTTEKAWMCVEVQVEPDGNLMLRTAKFEHRPGGWNTSAYPEPGGA